MMTEEEWLTSMKPSLMIYYLISRFELNWLERKLRLFCVANARYPKWFNPISERMKHQKLPNLTNLMLSIEKWIDEGGPSPKLDQSIVPGIWWIVSNDFKESTLYWCSDSSNARMSSQEQADVLRHLIGNPFRRSKDEDRRRMESL